MLDLSGWEPITCDESDAVRADILDNRVGPGAIISSLSDPEGTRTGLAVIYTEWGRDDVPELREYRWYDDRGCTHFVPTRSAP